jgi:BASS family bile acid:Na+ symporter
MFALGTTLGADDLRRVLARPRAFALGSLLPLLPETAVGLVIIASCPANAIAGLFTHFARGNTMLAVSLSAAASLMSAATVPLFVNLSLARFLADPAAVRLPVLPSALGLLLISTLPVGAGMRLRQTRPALAARIEAQMNVIGVLNDNDREFDPRLPRTAR